MARGDAVVRFSRSSSWTAGGAAAVWAPAIRMVGVRACKDDVQVSAAARWGSRVEHPILGPVQRVVFERLADLPGYTRWMHRTGLSAARPP
jgi:hypothetical protein